MAEIPNSKRPVNSDSTDQSNNGHFYAQITRNQATDPRLTDTEFRRLVWMMTFDLPDTKRAAGRRKREVRISNEDQRQAFGVKNKRNIAGINAQLEHKELIERCFNERGHPVIKLTLPAEWIVDADATPVNPQPPGGNGDRRAKKRGRKPAESLPDLRVNELKAHWDRHYEAIIRKPYIPLHAADGKALKGLLKQVSVDEIKCAMERCIPDTSKFWGDKKTIREFVSTINHWLQPAGATSAISADWLKPDEPPGKCNWCVHNTTALGDGSCSSYDADWNDACFKPRDGYVPDTK
jgi:hypothetical protein